MATAFLGSRAWLRSHGLTVGEFATELRRGDEPRFTWRSVDKKHWQALASGVGEPTAVTDAREGTGQGCRPGMVRVKGAFRREANGLSTGAMERLQDTACTDWISRDFPARCRTFDPEKLAPELAKIPTEPLDFCIDRFEYPNVLGENPMIVATFREAEAVCKKDQKRLCTENEWTFACEGEEARPYPYGWTRDDTACVIDRSWRPFAEGALQPRDSTKAREELDRLWQGEPSGSRPTCRSPFGVYDMTGNVDEWTRSVNPTGYSSVLKGGYWGPVRARCRPATRAHNEDFVAYQQSFRCCAESSGAPLETDAGASLAPEAGPSDAGALEAGAPAPGRTADLEIERSLDPEDEVEAIARERGIIHCGVGVAGRRDASMGVALTALAAVLMRVRRVRRRERRG